MPIDGSQVGSQADSNLIVVKMEILAQVGIGANCVGVMREIWYQMMLTPPSRLSHVEIEVIGGSDYMVKYYDDRVL